MEAGYEGESTRDVLGENKLLKQEENEAAQFWRSNQHDEWIDRTTRGIARRTGTERQKEAVDEEVVVLNRIPLVVLLPWREPK